VIFARRENARRGEDGPAGSCGNAVNGGVATGTTQQRPVAHPAAEDLHLLRYGRAGVAGAYLGYGVARGRGRAAAMRRIAACLVATVALVPALAGCGAATSAPSATGAHPSAVATVKCGLTSCSHGQVGQPCSIAGYPGIIVVATSSGGLACDPRDNVGSATGGTPTTAPAAASGSTCIFGANGVDVQVELTNQNGCSTDISALASFGLNWYPITSLASPGSAGSADQETMSQTCQLSKGSSTMTVMDAGGADYGNQICSAEEQDGWVPSASGG
jgi:hypothetical protein